MNGKIRFIILINLINDDARAVEKDEFFEPLGDFLEKINKRQEIFIQSDLNSRQTWETDNDR